jgi:hypothetical protein
MRAFVAAPVLVAVALVLSAPAASGGACTASRFAPQPSPAMAKTTWPTEHADGWRTHAVAAGLSSDVGHMKLHTRVATLPPVPVWGYVGRGDDLYVLGGSPYLLDMFTALILGAPRSSVPLLIARSKRYAETLTPYVARIDARSMRAKILPLTGGTSANYTGGLLVHANGFLYAVVRSTLYRIDPATLGVVASAPLPPAPEASGQPNQQTAYNGIQASANGDLILKGWASTGGGNLPPGILLRVDPGDLSIKVQLVTTDVAAARMALATVNGQEELYFPDQTQSVRWLLDPAAFALDTAWSQNYLAQGSTEASSDVFMGNGVVFASNTNPTATTPMQVFSQGAAEGSPLRSTKAFSSNSAQWNFFMMAGDPYKSGIAVVNDELSGHVSGFRVCSGGQGVRKLWENSAIRTSAGMAIDYRASQLYADDRRCTRTNCRLHLDVLSLRTGRRIASVPVKGDKPSIGQIFVGRNAVYYVATNTHDAHGYVTRVTASRR